MPASSQSGRCARPVEPTSSGVSSSQVPVQLAEHVAHAVRYILASQVRGRLLRLDDIKKHALPTLAAKTVRDVMTRAAAQLESVFGLKVVELNKKGELALANQLDPPAAPPAPPAPPAATLCDEEWRCHVHVPPAERRRRALVFIILAAIFMNDGVMSEATLWSFLNALELMEHDTHACFGDVKKFVTVDMVRQRYVRMTQSTVAGGQTGREFAWGDYATAILRPLDVLHFVCEVWGDNVKPSMWTSQHRRATEDSAAET